MPALLLVARLIAKSSGQFNRTNIGLSVLFLRLPNCPLERRVQLPLSCSERREERGEKREERRESLIKHGRVVVVKFSPALNRFGLPTLSFTLVQVGHSPTDHSSHNFLPNSNQNLGHQVNSSIFSQAKKFAKPQKSVFG